MRPPLTPRPAAARGPHFVFRHSWTVPADPSATFAALADLAHYPRWWPQVRAVASISADDAHVLIRSAAPVTLELDMHREVVDERSGVLATVLDGDLVGWARFTLHPDGPGRTRARYDQEVILAKAPLSHAPAFLHPLMRLNHAWMMRSGERGLARALRG